MSRLEEVLGGKLIMTADEAGSHQGCALGKWIYKIGLKDYGYIGDMRALEQAHHAFHDSVRGVLLLKTEGKDKEARRELSSATKLSERIMQLVSGVEKSVHEMQSVNIVVLRAEDRQFGLVVDEINDTEEIVVKPLSKQLKVINTYAGATIMGDGKVALILDVMGLAQRASVISEARDRGLGEDEGAHGTAASKNGCQTVLLFQYGENRRMAIDLALVARLEEIARSSVEVTAEQEVVQYRGQIMPLIRVSEALRGEPRAAESTQDSLQVVVYSDKGRSVGLIVDRILDIVEEPFVVQGQTGRNGIQGSAVIQKRVTDILDVATLIVAAEQQRMAAAAQV
jgi:two-component system chemotaxis sensor kinase CheA